MNLIVPHGYVEKSVEYMMDDYEEYMMHQAFYTKCNLDMCSKCVLECPGCMRQDLKAKNKIKNSTAISIDNFRKVANYFSGINMCGQISDPIYHPKFKEILAITNEYPKKRFIISTAAHQKNIDWYKDAYSIHGDNVTWRFGLDNLPGEVPEYRIKQNSKLVFEAMFLGAKLGKKVQWQFIVLDFNQYKIEEARQIAKNIDVELMMVISDRFRNNASSPQKYRNKYSAHNAKRIMI